MGAREVVAKALALECLRQARQQQRACYLYSFSGAPRPSAPSPCMRPNPLPRPAPGAASREPFGRQPFGRMAARQGLATVRSSSSL